MPRLGKQAISNYLRSECKRRLKFDLYPATKEFASERLIEALPPRDVSRPGISALADEGEKWEKAKLNDLANTFGISQIIGQYKREPDGTLVFADNDLINVIGKARPHSFIIQATYDVGSTFENALSIASYRTIYSLKYSKLRPDIIQVLEPNTSKRPYSVNPDGSLADIQIDDTRIPLRVIDIKLTAEASVPHFAEVAYYSMVLAGWLCDNGLESTFYVVPNAAIWPGSHDASSLVRLQNQARVSGAILTSGDLLNALDDDLESIEFMVFSSRIRRFLIEEISYVLATPWRQLSWHVDGHCIGCEYLGYQWSATKAQHPDHCWPMAEVQNHLSRVAFVSRGAREALEDNGISNVSDLASKSNTDPAFNAHQVLRATKTVVAGRAQALETGNAFIPSQAGTSAMMPNWADLRIYLNAEFDIGSGITIAFGMKALWAVDKKKVAADQHFKVWNEQSFIVDIKDHKREQEELLNLLRRIDEAMQFAKKTLADSTVQIYIWDSITYEHIVRVVGRNLNVIIANRTLRSLAWLFPPEEIVQNPDISNRMNPITIVKDVTRALVASPVPHYYSILNIARAYHSARTVSPYNQFAVQALFEDPLSDYIPSERAHEIWIRASGTRPWNVQLRILDDTVRVKLRALESITQRLGEDLHGELDQTAPKIKKLNPPSLPNKMAEDARLWYVFAKLNTALKELDIQRTQAMPEHERVARLKSAVLENRVVGVSRNRILSACGLGDLSNRKVYAISQESREAKIREGDINFALSPLGDSKFLSRSLCVVADNTPLRIPSFLSDWSPMSTVMKVAIKAIDRDNGYIVIDFDNNCNAIIADLERAGRIDLSNNLIIDPIHKDYFIPKLEVALNAIGNPPIASSNANLLLAIGQTRKPTAGTMSPVAELLWNANALNLASVSRNLPPIKTQLSANGFDLNASQWHAWEEALSHRFQLIWGPPGTGKSRTLKSIILGAVIDALQHNKPIRILLSGPTYEAIDNVLLDLYGALAPGGIFSSPSVLIARLRSSLRESDTGIPTAIDIPCDKNNPQFTDLVNHLNACDGIIILGTTPQQAHNLYTNNGNSPVQEYFDLIVIDEASQMDTATATLVLSALACGGSVIIAGDPKQLPPIHQAEAPVNLDYMVGPIFTYFKERFNINECVLEENYRSGETIVKLAHLAGYPQTLTAFSPDLSLSLQSLPSSAIPTAWPPSLHWSADLEQLLDPQKKTVCFVYPEGKSSQWNYFEADTVAALICLLHGRLNDQLQNEIDSATGIPIATSSVPYTNETFWTKGVGVVTPHRAQQALIMAKLQNAFSGVDGQLIRNAVDTVERFQGQQRDVIIATYALGDPDAISDEDEFLLSLNRFNVMASRARAKLIVLISQEIVDYLSSDAKVLKESVLIKSFVEIFCNQTTRFSICYNNPVTGTLESKAGSLRWR